MKLRLPLSEQLTIPIWQPAACTIGEACDGTGNSTDIKDV